MPDPNQNNPQPISQPTVPVSPVDLPPLPPDFQNIANPQTVTKPTGSGSPDNAAPPGLPPIISTPKKKFGGGKIIATILGILLLIGGVGAGILLTQQKQLIPQKAAGCDPNGGPDGGCGAGQGCSCTGGDCTCGPDGGQESCYHTICPPGWSCTGSGQDAYCVDDSGGGGGGSSCIGCVDGVGPSQGMHNVVGLKINKTSPTSAALSWTYTEGRACVKRGGTYIFIGTDKAQIDNQCGLPGGSFWELNVQLPAGCDWVRRVNGGIMAFDTSQSGITLDANKTYYFRVVARYFWTQTFPNHPGEEEDQGEWCGGLTVTPPGAGSCIGVKAYNSAWLLLTSADLSKLKANAVVNFCAGGSADSGSFDKAQFKINATVENETTSKGQGDAANDFCQSYTIKSTDKTIEVKAKVHHTTLDWIGETF